MMTRLSDRATFNKHSITVSSQGNNQGNEMKGTQIVKGEGKLSLFCRWHDHI